MAASAGAVQTQLLVLLPRSGLASLPAGKQWGRTPPVVASASQSSSFLESRQQGIAECAQASAACSGEGRPFEIGAGPASAHSNQHLPNQKSTNHPPCLRPRPSSRCQPAPLVPQRNQALVLKVKRDSPLFPFQQKTRQRVRSSQHQLLTVLLPANSNKPNLNHTHPSSISPRSSRLPP